MEMFSSEVKLIIDKDKVLRTETNFFFWKWQ